MADKPRSVYFSDEEWRQIRIAAAERSMSASLLLYSTVKEAHPEWFRRNALPAKASAPST